MLIKVSQWLTKLNEKPLPLRTMKVVKIERQTNKAILVKLQGTPSPSGECMHCGRTITHPVSLHFGIGSTCIQNYPQLLESIDENDIASSYEKLKQEMSKITWEGWLPKSHFEYINETEHTAPERHVIDITFLYDNQIYHVQTENIEKVEKIKQHAQEIIREELVAL